MFYYKTLLTRVALVMCLGGVTFSSPALECMIAPSIMYDFRDQWENIPPDCPPLVVYVSRVVKKQYFEINMFFRDFALKDGKPAAVFDIKMTGPEKKVYFELKNRAVFDSKETFKESTSLYLSANSFKVCFEPKDALGKYDIVITARDNNSGKTATSSAWVVLVTPEEMSAEAKFSGNQSDFKFVSSYYLHPQPERVIPFFLMACDFMTQQKNSKNPKKIDPMPLMAFFYHVLDQNRYLIPPLAEAGKNLDLSYRKMLVILFHFLNEKDNALYEQLGPDAVAFRNTLKGPNPFVIQDPRAPYQLDCLWSEFFATGRFKPVLEIAKTIRYVDNSRSNEEQINELKNDKAKLTLMLTGAAARWSIGSNMTQHKMVLFYCKNMVRQKTLEPQVIACLQDMIERNGNPAVKK